MEQMELYRKGFWELKQAGILQFVDFIDESGTENTKDEGDNAILSLSLSLTILQRRKEYLTGCETKKSLSNVCFAVLVNSGKGAN